MSQSLDSLNEKLSQLEVESEFKEKLSDQSNLYIGNLPSSFTQDSLSALFSPFGTIVRCRVASNQTINQTSSYGFVQFDNVESAQIAIQQLNDVQVEDKIIKVRVANPPSSQSIQPFIANNLYVSSLPPSFNEVDLVGLFQPFGSILNHRILLDNMTGASRGIGFVCFETHEEAEKAVTSLNGLLLPDQTIPLTVKYAKESASAKLQSQQFRNYPFDHSKHIPFPPSPQKPKTNVYVSGLPDSMSEDELSEHFSPFGTIQACKILLDGQNKSRGIGFVRFETYDAALASIKALNGTTLTEESSPIIVKFARENHHHSQRRDNPDLMMMFPYYPNNMQAMYQRIQLAHFSQPYYGYPYDWQFPQMQAENETNSESPKGVVWPEPQPVQKHTF